MPAPTNISFLTATDLGTLPAAVMAQVDFGGTTYTVYYKFTAPVDSVVTGAFAYGDALVYTPQIRIYLGPAGTPVEICSGVIAPINKPCQFPATTGSEYFLEIIPNGGNPTPANLSLSVYSAPNVTVPIGSIAVNDDNDVGLPLALLSSTIDYTALKFISPFPSGEGGDVLVSGVSCVEDISNSSVKNYSSAYALVATNILSDTIRVRTCLGANEFGIAVNKNPVNVYSLTAAGVLSAAEVLTGMTSCNGFALSNDKSIAYHCFTGNNVPIRQWDMVGHAAGANLVAGVANYRTVDILVDNDDYIYVSLYKTSGGQDFQVKRYNPAGVLQNTYSSFAAPGGRTAPRLFYDIEDTTYFWVMLSTATAGLTKFYKVTISDGSFAIERNQEEFEFGMYGGAATASPLGSFGAAFSCPAWLTRTAVTPPVVANSGLYTVSGTGAQDDGHGINPNPVIRHDQTWIDTQAGTFENVKIRDPYYDTFLAGDE